MNENHDDKGRFAAANSGANALRQNANKMGQASTRTSDPRLSSMQSQLARADLKSVERIKAGNPQKADLQKAANALDKQARELHRESLRPNNPFKVPHAMMAQDALKYAATLRTSTPTQIKVAVQTYHEQKALKINGR